MRAPYRHRVPRKHQRVLLVLHRAYREDRPMQVRDIAYKSGVDLHKVFSVLTRLRDHGWVTRRVERVSYSMTVYGIILTPAGYHQVTRQMSDRRWKRQHRRINGCKWDPDRMKIDA